MAHFYLDESIGSAAVGDTLTLTGPEARHAASVSRLRVGETVRLGNGHGLMLTVEATAIDKDRIAFAVRDVVTADAPVIRVVLVQALTKGDRDERAIEAATELGVDDVVPWGARRSVSVWTDNKVERGVERWRGIVREAAKQSIRPFVPVVHDYENIDSLAQRLNGDVIFVLDPTGDVASSRDWITHVTNARESGTNIAIVVGPEGGIAADELARFEAAGAIRVCLGSHILRSSTAGPAFLAAINGALGRW